jgi:hypothetical protein
MEKTKETVQLHNSPKELALQTLKNLCLCNVICVVIVFSMSAVMNMGVWGILLTELICLLITGLTLYTQSWGFGDKDANYIQFGRMEYDAKKPWVYGLIALAPSLVSDILLIISKLTSLDWLWVYRLMNAPVWPLINLIHPYGVHFHEATEETILMEGTQYEEVVAAADATPGAGWGKLILMMLLPLLYLLFMVLGYELGRRRISIGDKMVYVNKDKKKK